MATLYELQGKYAQLLAIAEDGTVDPEVLRDTMDSITDAIDDKAVGYAQVITQLNADAKQLKDEINRLQDRMSSITRNASNMKMALMQAMDDTGKQKIKSPLFTIWTQNSTSVVIKDDNPNNLNPAYLVPQPAKPDKKLIKEDLQAGKEVIGAELRVSQSLRIR